MRFIPKKVLTEGMAANPLDKGVSKDQDITSLAQQGILTAVAAETDAINQYDQIKDLISRSEGWLNKKAMPVIEDIVSEEKKHLAQLTELVKQLPAYEEDMKKGEEETKSGEDKDESIKESLSESVQEKAEGMGIRFDLEVILNILEQYGIDSTRLDTLIDTYDSVLSADQVDELLAGVGLSFDVLDAVEKDIIEKANVDRNTNAQQAAEEKEVIQEDLYLLKDLIEDDIDGYDPHHLHNPMIKQRIRSLIEEYETVAQ